MFGNKKLSKEEIAGMHVNNATDLFANAGDSLGAAIQLLGDSEGEHRALVEEHSLLAENARLTRERSERVKNRLDALLS